MARTRAVGKPGIFSAFSASGGRLIFERENASVGIEYGTDGSGFNNTWFGETAGAKMDWAASGDELILTNAEARIASSSIGSLVGSTISTDSLHAVSASLQLVVITSASIMGTLYFPSASVAGKIVMASASITGTLGISSASVTMIEGTLAITSVDTTFTGGTMNLDGASVKGALVFSASTNITFDTTSGSKIGTASTEKIGFWGATPAAQPTKGSYNNFAAASDMLEALVDIGILGAT